jgi:ABC-type antimicrobial peptide transport system permease subunit
VALGFGKALWVYGWIAAGNMPVASVLLVALMATALGVLLSAAGAVYPAWVAARLAPLEAMRVE